MSLDDPGSTRLHREGPPPRSDKHPLNWLLLLPLLVTLIPPLYNRLQPELFGIPFFYWYQLAVISVGVITTLIVYRVSTRR
ncbi:MAG: hypothetical protein AVDCRST_MAG16-1786 [uncultured Frankineae bacterium]|uniref:DUF3311 domain-containing protein n=1 Tax=uncultured Frankineae bacterium TaxID=437475 RepID=A0A6J4LRW8_9ACTN|nr:MAG: hypothetical protein AVDCRST_MAG16-1786 [uncultured Frankineae bacterium]